MVMQIINGQIFSKQKLRIIIVISFTMQSSANFGQ